MKRARNERGIALVTALLLTLISLGIAMALLYFISQGTKVSAAHKRYKSSRDAAYGGVEVFTKSVIPSVLSNTALDPLFAPAFANMSCLQRKLAYPPTLWGAVCGSATRTIDAKNAPDNTFVLKGPPFQPNFTIFAKVVDTIPGNSDASGVDYLESAAGVAYGSSGVKPQHMPALYRIEVTAERENNSKEKANLSVLYVY